MVSRSVVLLLQVWLAQQAFSTLHTVPTDFSKIQDAVDAASTGDTIRVFAGTYTEHINIVKSLVLIGSGPDTATIIEAPLDFGSNPAYDYSLANFNKERAIIHIGTATPIMVVFRGFVVDGVRRGPNFNLGGSSYVAYSGVLAERCTIRVEQCIVRNILPSDSTNATWDPNKTANGRAVHVRGAGAVAEILNNTIQDINRYHILVNATDNSNLPSVFPYAVVQGNTIIGKGLYNGGQKGIWFNNGAWGSIESNIISGHDYTDPNIEPERSSGIVIRFGYNNPSKHTRIAGNTVTSTTAIQNKGIYVQGNGDSVLNNTVSGYRYGIEVHDSKRTVLANNTVTGGRMGVLINCELGAREDTIVIGGSPENKNTITGQPLPANGGFAISLSYRDPYGDDFESTVPLDARYNDFGVYTSDSVAARIFDRADTMHNPPLDTVLAWPFYSPKVRVAAKVMLEGAFSGGSMTRMLNTGGTLASHFVAIPIPGLAVDSISIEIRNSATASGSTIRKYAPAWVLSDGTIRGFADTTKSYVEFDTTAGDYYIVTRHRNHLGIMSNVTSQLTMPSIPTSYDFTVLGSAYGISPTKLLSGSVYGMFAGDSDLNGGVGASDLVKVRGRVGLTGYLPEDVDMNAGVGASDLVKVRLNIGQSSQVP